MNATLRTMRKINDFLDRWGFWLLVIGLTILLLVSCRTSVPPTVDCPLYGVTYIDYPRSTETVSREWRVVDWCIYDGKKGIWSYYEVVPVDAPDVMPKRVKNKINE